MDKAIKILKKYINPSTRIALAVSGGEDSMCLCDIVYKAPFINKENIMIININHLIRKESDKDSQFVISWAREHNIKCVCATCDIPALSKEKGISEETAGRLFRREQFDSLLKSEVDLVLTAHHYLDQAETVLMHIFRGTGLKGLVGMKEFDNGYLRPLITTTKQEIMDYVKENDIPYCVDKTNFDTRYNRNYIRKEIIPKIEERYSLNFVQKLTQNASIDNEFISSFIDEDKVGYNGSESWLCDEIFSLPLALSSRYIFLALSKLGLKCDITLDHIQSVITLSHNQSGKKVDILGDIKGIKEYDKIVFYHDIPLEKEELEFFIGTTSFGDSIISITPCDKNIVKGELKIDADKAEGAVIRYKREGDIFTPCNSHTKKLKKYLIDKKIPSRIKDKLPLLCYNNVVLAIFGVAISDFVKIQDTTTNAVMLRIDN